MLAPSRIRRIITALFICGISISFISASVVKAADEIGPAEFATPDVLLKICMALDAWHVTPIDWPTVFATGFEAAAKTNREAADALRHMASDSNKTAIRAADRLWMRDRIAELVRINDETAHLSAGTLSKVFADAVVESADPHGAIYWPNEPAIDPGNSVQSDSIGAELRLCPNNEIKIYPAEFSAAAKAGILYGESLVAIDGHPALELGNSFRLLEGARGSTVKLTLRALQGGAKYSVNVVRTVIEIRPVRGLDSYDPSKRYVLPEAADIGYIQVLRFTKDVATDLATALKQAKSDGAKKYVIDLRGNSGGLLPSAAQVLDLFLADGELYRTAGRGTPRTSSADIVEVAHPSPDDFEGSIAILIDQQTASGAEITAQALRLRGRAILIGSQTVGKNDIQMLFNFRPQALLKLTTSVILFADGSTIPQDGLKPDVSVDTTPAQQEQIIRSWRNYVIGKAPKQQPTDFDPVLNAAVKALNK